VLDLDALLFDRVAHTLKIKGEDYFAFVAVVQNAERGGIESRRNLVHEYAGVQFAQEIGHDCHAIITHGFTSESGCHRRNFSIHNTEEHLRLTAARVDWVMSPSPGDALVCCVKRAVPETKNWHRQDYTQHS
jgi:hypothetical protein